MAALPGVYTSSSGARSSSAALDGASLTLSFAANGNGQAILAVSAADPAGASVLDEFVVTVNPVNDPPAAQDAAITVVAGQSQAISLNYGDLETAQANLQFGLGALIGQLDTSSLPNVVYTAPAAAGEDTFTNTITDRGDPDGCSADVPPCAAPQSATATIHLTVLPVPSAGINFGAVYPADLKVGMTYSVSGKQIVYAIVVTNDGPADAIDAALADALPGTVGYVSVITTQGTCSGGKTITCNFGTLASSQSATVTLKVNRTNTKVAVVNTATVTSGVFDIDPADNTATATVP